jgi:hypothetical protein
MTQLLKFLPLFTVLVAAPAFAAEPDPHAGHHPAMATDVAQPAAPAADADAKSLMHPCKMMDGKMMAGSAAMAAKGPEGKMIMEPKDMHCMLAPAAATGAKAAHDHEHPAAAPK